MQQERQKNASFWKRNRLNIALVASFGSALVVGCGQKNTNHSPGPDSPGASVTRSLEKNSPRSESTEVGAQFPRLTVQKTDGTAVDVDSFRGKTLVIYNFGNEINASQKAMDKLSQVSTNNPDVAVLGIALDAKSVSGARGKIPAGYIDSQTEQKVFGTHLARIYIVDAKGNLDYVLDDMTIKVNEPGFDADLADAISKGKQGSGGEATGDFQSEVDKYNKDVYHNPIPDFSLMDTNSNAVPLSKFDQDNLIIFYYDGSFAPAKQEYADLKSLKATHPQIKILTIVPDEAEAAGLGSPADETFISPDLNNDSPYAKYLFIHGSPSIVLVGKGRSYKKTINSAVGANDLGLLEDALQNGGDVNSINLNHAITQPTVEAKAGSSDSAEIDKLFPNITLNWQNGGFAETNALRGRPVVLYNYVSKMLLDDTIVKRLKILRADFNQNVRVYGVSLGAENITGAVANAIEVGYVDNDTELNAFGGGKTNDKTGLYFIAADGTLKAFMPDNAYDSGVFEADLAKLKN